MTDFLLTEPSGTTPLPQARRHWLQAPLVSIAALAGYAAAFWLLQLGLCLADPAADTRSIFADSALFCTLVISFLATLTLGAGRASLLDVGKRVAARTGFGAALLALAHLLTLFAIAGTPQFGQTAALYSALTLATAALTGAGIAWLRRHSAAFGFLLGLILLCCCGAVAVHLAAIAAVAQEISSARLPVLVFCLLVTVGASALGLGLRVAGTSHALRLAAIAPPGRFRNIVQSLPLPVALTSPEDGRILFANDRFTEQFGLRVGESATALHVANPADRERFVELVRRNGVIEGYEAEVRGPDGTMAWVLITARMAVFDGEPAILCGYHDISDRKMTEAALLTGEVRYALVSRAANDGIWDWDIADGSVYYSSRWRELAGVEPGTRINTIDDWFSRVHPEDIERLRGDLQDHLAGRTPQLDTEYRIRHGNGHYYWMQCRALVLRNGERKPIRIAGSQADITLRKTYEANLLNAAYEDRLTGINNRAFFTHLVDTRATGSLIAGTTILLCNIDQFRRVNDSLGPGAGDALLIAVARRLSQRTLGEDALSRLGADEFAIWFKDMPDPDEAGKVAGSILADLCQPYTLGDIEMPVTVSIGIATPTVGEALSGADLLRHARLALDHAKEQGGSRVELFDTPLLQETNLRRQLSRDLTNAERFGQIFMEYQPIVELASNGGSRIAGFEALMRWRHPHLGLIMPTRFIPLAEESGLIGPLGLHALATAAQDMRSWMEAGLADEDCTISVNLSARQVSDRAGIARLLGAIDSLDIPLPRIKLEITESVLMNDPEAMVDTLEALRRRGVMILLDDFGTGYSSLSYLHRFPLYAIKIDRSFVNRMVQAPEAFRLVRSIIELGHDLGLRVVAEGVETGDEAERLRDLGCDYAQGHLFSHAVPAEMAAQLLARRVI